MTIKHSISINQVRALEWGLNLSEAVVFSWLYSVPSWASELIIGKEVFYHASKTKALTDLPLLTGKVDTIYRLYKSIEAKGLIKVVRVSKKDYIKLSAKAKLWDFSTLNKPVENSEINPSTGNKSEKVGENSEINPSKSVENSEINPTYNNTINTDSITNTDKKTLGEIAAKPPTPQELLLVRQEQFCKEVCLFSKEYDQAMLDEFYDYWREPNISKTKMKFEKETTWELGLRLKTWSARRNRFNRKQVIQPSQNNFKSVFTNPNDNKW